MSPAIDPFLAMISSLPGMPLGRWPFWSILRRERPVTARRLALLLATGLRESLEEMRLNPVGVQFIGPLPTVRLIMFDRQIFPMVGWVRKQKKFFPNWEVEKVVEIPIRHLLTNDYYRRYRLSLSSGGIPQTRDYPCFVHYDGEKTELLWGATYRITLAFLEKIFKFTPPALDTLPVVRGTLDDNYINGGSRNRGA